MSDIQRMSVWMYWIPGIQSHLLAIVQLKVVGSPSAVCGSLTTIHHSNYKITMAVDQLQGMPLSVPITLSTIPYISRIQLQ